MARKVARRKASTKTKSSTKPKSAAKRQAGKGRGLKSQRSDLKSQISDFKSDGQPQTIGRYLIERLQHYGVRDLFGIPGDFVLNFYGMLEESPIRVIGCTREDNAGYAADAYARVNGLGAVCVTYCVGGLSLCNSIAGAYAEKSPVVVISGAPGIAERESDPLLHHRVRDFMTQRDVFEKITVAAASLDDPLTAFREIDRCLQAAVRYKRPVYLELPRDRVDAPALYPHEPLITRLQSSADALAASLTDRKSTRLNSSHTDISRMPSSA